MVLLPGWSLMVQEVDETGSLLGWRREELTKSEQSCESIRKWTKFTYVHTQRSGGLSSLSGTHLSESDGHTPLCEALDEAMRWNKETSKTSKKKILQQSPVEAPRWLLTSLCTNGPYWAVAGSLHKKNFLFLDISSVNAKATLLTPKRTLVCEGTF